MRRRHTGLLSAVLALGLLASAQAQSPPLRPGLALLRTATTSASGEERARAAQVDSLLRSSISCLEITPIPLDTLGQRPAPTVQGDPGTYVAARWLVGGALVTLPRDSGFLRLYLFDVETSERLFTLTARIPLRELATVIPAFVDTAATRAGVPRGRC